MVYYTGPNRKVTRLTKDSSPTDVPNQPLPTPTSSSSSSSSFPTWAIWAIVAAVAIVIVAGGTYYYKSSKSNTNESKFYEINRNWLQSSGLLIKG